MKTCKMENKNLNLENFLDIQNFLIFFLKIGKKIRFAKSQNIKSKFCSFLENLKLLQYFVKISKSFKI